MFPNFVLLFLLNASQEVLLLRRINTPFGNNCYALPGGQIPRGMTARQALQQEVSNILGITIALDDLEFAHIMYRKCNEPEFFTCVFTTKIWSGMVHNKDQEKHDDLLWCALDKLPTPMVPAHAHAIQQIAKQTSYSEHGWEKRA